LPYDLNIENPEEVFVWVIPRVWIAAGCFKKDYGPKYYSASVREIYRTLLTTTITEVRMTWIS
jgi:hypothetical protein